ncbi:TetR/AcrR family transcriptional regulator [Paraburkholderia acidisoli]|uniref:TetR family transcriptional regulator n=1 Tax=Paraburkholderia acidisoli TaxID=2571748 RepID=A0A7Z2JHS4_9BURK|nr:TetR/AcrR family transcriptional regulator [Paraburkholderia acidisoli]QGZ63560.1 TetR family transcriptional regulator [Paraburkholderia acidisoli]
MRKKTEEKRQSIIEAALDVFREVGFEQASMTQIATRSGASKATLYGYFESKEALFAEAMTSRAGTEIRNAFDQLTLDVPLAQSLAAFGLQYLTAVLQPTFLATRRLSYHEVDRSNVGRTLYESGPKRGLMHVRDFLAGATEAGVLRRCDPRAAAQHLLALLEAELVEIAMLGYEVKVTRAKLLPVVKRAVDAFVAAYGALDSERG